MIIESINNEKIKYFKKIREIKNIKKYKEFIVEGEHLVEEAIKCGYAKKIIILEGNDFDTDLEKIYVTEKVMKYISTLESKSYVMAVCNIKENSEIIGNKILILDNVQDPGNIGTLLRSAAGFNVSTIILSTDSVNVYNDKIIRATQGMIFNSNIVYMDLKEAIEKIKKLNINIYGTSLNNSNNFSEEEIPSSYALILGNEGNGVREEMLSMCDKNIKIEINNKLESLNVAVAGSIIMYAWRK